MVEMVSCLPATRKQSVVLNCVMLQSSESSLLGRGRRYSYCHHILLNGAAVESVLLTRLISSGGIVCETGDSINI